MSDQCRVGVPQCPVPGTADAVAVPTALPQPSQQPGQREADDIRPIRAYRSVT